MNDPGEPRRQMLGQDNLKEPMLGKQFDEEREL